MARNLVMFSMLLCTFTWVQAQENIPSAEAQLKTAVLAAPLQSKDSVTVYGYNQEGEFTMLRKGTNDMICLADDPTNPGFSVSCYHQSLEPFMARGRELKSQGKSFQEIFGMREAEVKSGELKMPEDGTTLFVYYLPEEQYNAAAGEVAGGHFRYVVYIPYATAESTGLPLSPAAPGMPWIMDPGTHRAHIMITPPAKEKEEE